MKIQRARGRDTNNQPRAPLFFIQNVCFFIFLFLHPRSSNFIFHLFIFSFLHPRNLNFIRSFFHPDIFSSERFFIRAFFHPVVFSSGHFFIRSFFHPDIFYPIVFSSCRFSSCGFFIRGPKDLRESVNRPPRSCDLEIHSEITQRDKNGRACS